MSYNWLSKQNRRKLRSLGAHSAGRLRKQRRARKARDAWRAPLASVTPVRAAKLGLIAFCYDLFKNNKY